MKDASIQPETRTLAAIILAAGKGTRMESDLPKVVHAVAGQPMVKWVVEAVREVGASPIVLVVGHGSEKVRDIFTDDDADLAFALQEPQLGTGHAVAQAKPTLNAQVSEAEVLVLCGDGPLIRAQTLRTLIDMHHKSGAAATLATATVSDPTGYGRVVRDSAGAFLGIVEHNDATPEQRDIREINPSYYIFRISSLFSALESITNKNAKGEYYLTDVFPILRARGERIEVVDAVPPEDVLSINTPAQLEQVSKILESRLQGTSTDSAATRRTSA